MIIISMRCGLFTLLSDDLASGLTYTSLDFFKAEFGGVETQSFLLSGVRSPISLPTIFKRLLLVFTFHQQNTPKRFDLF